MAETLSHRDDDATRQAIDRIQKLMRLSAKNPNEHEAAAALAKAQELLVAFNLDLATVEDRDGGSGQRLDERVRGGMYSYQKTLWRNIAELNFCMYWTQRVKSKTGLDSHGRKVRTTFEHRLVGRKVNVISTQNMADYILGTVERLCRERMGDAREKSGSSWMIAFREGIVDRVAEKIATRREEIINQEEEKQAEAARRASAAGVSLSRTLTIAGLADREEQANYDFFFGEGAWARRAAKRAAARAERAKAMAEAERLAAEWAAANPQEAAREAAKERARERRRENYVPRGRYRFRQTKEEMRRDSSGYHAGYEAGEDVSIDPQVAQDQRRIGRGRRRHS